MYGVPTPVRLQGQRGADAATDGRQWWVPCPLQHGRRSGNVPPVSDGNATPDGNGGEVPPDPTNRPGFARLRVRMSCAY